MATLGEVGVDESHELNDVVDFSNVFFEVLCTVFSPFCGLKFCRRCIGRVAW